MKTPALRPFLDSVGHVVHYLNTIAVGLAGVESGVCTKPETLDISWNPKDIKSSSRGARAFALNSAIVFLAEELGAYTNTILGCPGFKSIALPKDPDRAQKFIALHQHLELPEDQLFLGCLVAIHWRNRIIHKRSNAGLTKTQETALISDYSSVLYADYKHLDAKLLLEHFSKKLPSLKDVSSLIALSINCVRRIEEAIPEPKSSQDVEDWLSHLKLSSDLDRVIRASVNTPRPEQAVTNFFTTRCPELAGAYALFCMPKG
ncbi:hypothetical protein GSY71_17645 [Pusillimonas sp. TS35]|nr:hypothetical protein [Pusillimonas sp. TS35]